MSEPHSGSIVIIRANLGCEILLLLKPPWGRQDELRKQMGKRKRVGIGKWGLPGGGCDEGESTLQCARRETLAETGYEFALEEFVKVGTLEGYHQFEGQAPVLRWVPDIYMIHANPKTRAQPIRWNPGEHIDGRWFPRQAIPWKQMIPSDREWIPDLLAGKALDRIQVCFEGEDEDRTLYCWK